MKTRKFIKLVFISVLLFSCKKQYKEDTTVYFHLYNPVTNEAYSGVKVAVYEQKDVTSVLKLQNEYESNKIWEGVTDAYGKASHSFKTYKKDKYTYWHSVDESFMAGKKKIEQPEYGPLKKMVKNNLTYKAVSDNINIIIWWKNNYCFDENDKCKFRERSILKGENWSLWKPSTTSFHPNGYIEGCYEYMSSSVGQTHQNIYEIEYEVIRNGMTTFFKDTLYIIGNNSVDTLKYFY